MSDMLDIRHQLRSQHHRDYRSHRRHKYNLAVRVMVRGRVRVRVRVRAQHVPDRCQIGVR